MNKDEFLENFKQAINRNDNVSPEMKLSSISEWDSLGSMCVIAMFEEELSQNLDFSEIEKMNTVQDLMNKAGIK